MTCDPWPVLKPRRFLRLPRCFLHMNCNLIQGKLCFYFVFALFSKKNRPMLQISRKTTEKPTNELKSKWRWHQRERKAYDSTGVPQCSLHKLFEWVLSLAIPTVAIVPQRCRWVHSWCFYRFEIFISNKEQSWRLLPQAFFPVCGSWIWRKTCHLIYILIVIRKYPVILSTGYLPFLIAVMNGNNCMLQRWPQCHHLQ